MIVKTRVWFIPGFRMDTRKIRRLWRISQAVILVITCLLSPHGAQTATKPILRLSTSTLPVYASSLRFEHRNRYNAAQLFLLNQELIKRTEIPKTQAVLNRLEQTADWSVKPIVSIERIMVLLKKKDYQGLLNFLVDLAKSPEGALFEETIFTILTEQYTDYADPQTIQRALQHLLPLFNKWHQDPELISWMLAFFKPGDTLYFTLAVHLWAIADANNLPAQLKQIPTDLKKSSRGHQQVIASHFATQSRLKNRSYIIAETPLYLSRMEFDNIGFKKTRHTYFKAFFQKRQYTKLIDLLSRTDQKRPYFLTEEEQSSLLFRLWLKKGYITEALKYLSRLEKSADRHTLGGNYFELAEFYFSRNRFKESLPYYLRISPKNAPESLIPIVQWRKLWSYYKLNNTKGMQKISKWSDTYRFESQEVAAKFCYWNIKLKLDARRRALSCYQEYPLTYYGFRSLQLGGNYSGIEKTIAPKQSKTAKRPLLKEEQDFLEFIHVLYLSGNKEFADTLVKRYAKKQINQVFFRHLAKVLFRAERYYLQQLLVDLYFKETLKNPENANHPLLTAYYPAGYFREVTRHIGRTTLPQMLAFAVMREESNFRPEVQSPAGAIGLMQLMPSTARYVAKTIRTKYRPAQLSHPDFNVKLGVAYLKRLLRRYKGNLFYTLAAYNGGATNVKRWRKKANSGDFDIFVETISYIETQNYVKRVIRSYFIYQLLYGEKIPVDSIGLLSTVTHRVPDISA